MSDQWFDFGRGADRDHPFRHFNCFRRWDDLNLSRSTRDIRKDQSVTLFQRDRPGFARLIIPLRCDHPEKMS